MIQQAIGLLLIFFITGFTFIYMLFPRKGELDPEYDMLYRLAFGVTMSIVILVLFGFSLDALSSDTPGTGYVTGTNLWLGLSMLSLFFFFLGWWRGAYPWMGRIHRGLLRLPKSPPHSVLAELDDDKKLLARFRELSIDREKLRRELKEVERRVRLQTGSLRQHYEKRRGEVQAGLKRIDDQLRELEERRAAELYTK